MRKLEVMRVRQQARHDVMTGKTPSIVHESYFVIDGENAALNEVVTGVTAPMANL